MDLNAKTAKSAKEEAKENRVENVKWSMVMPVRLVITKLAVMLSVLVMWRHDHIDVDG